MSPWIVVQARMVTSIKDVLEETISDPRSRIYIPEPALREFCLALHRRDEGSSWYDLRPGPSQEMSDFWNVYADALEEHGYRDRVDLARDFAKLGDPDPRPYVAREYVLFGGDPDRSQIRNWRRNVRPGLANERRRNDKKYEHLLGRRR